MNGARKNWLNIKLNAKEKDLIKRASELDERSMSNFVRRIVIPAAVATIEKNGGTAE